MDIELIGALRDNARRVLLDHCTSDRLHRFIDHHAGEHDAALWRTAAELGWLALAVPEEHGGMGAGIAEVAALREELGAFLAPIPFDSTMLVARALTLWPHAAPRTNWLPKLAAGESIGAVGPLAADDSGLDASRLDGQYRINGECAPLLDGNIADRFLVRISTQAGPGIALLERSPGLETHAMPTADRTRTVATLRCHDVTVPSDQVLCGDEAAAVSEQLADEARILIAADAVGGAQAILDTTVEYLKIRVQFGKPIGTFQALKHRCADHKVALEASKRLLEHAKARLEAPDRGTWASLAKFAACDCYAALAGDGVQLHGGIGFTWEHNAHLFLKRALLDQCLFGNSAQQQDRAAALLLAGERVQ